MPLKILDTAHYTTLLDPKKVQADGVINKATQGDDFQDPSFIDKTVGFLDDDLVVGGYHFFDPSKDPIAQADLFSRSCQGATQEPLLLGVDIEECVKNNVDVWTDLRPSQRGADIFQFLGRVKQYYKGFPLIYMGQEFYRQFLSGVDFSACPLWVPDYKQSSIASGKPDLPDCWNTWTIWQSSGKDKEQGLNGYADLDTFAGTLDQLKALCCVPV